MSVYGWEKFSLTINKRALAYSTQQKKKREREEDELKKLVTVMGEEMELMCSSAKINKQNAIVESAHKKKPFTEARRKLRQKTLRSSGVRRQ